MTLDTNPTNGSTIQQMQLAAIPITRVHVEKTAETYFLVIDGRVPSDLMRQHHEELRQELMFTWQWPSIERCSVDIFFIGSTAMNMPKAALDTISLLVGAGIIESISPVNLTHLCAHAKRGSGRYTERTEIRIESR